MAEGLDITKIAAVIILFGLGMVFLLAYVGSLYNMVSGIFGSQPTLSEKTAETLCGYPFGSEQSYYLAWDKGPEATQDFLESVLLGLVTCTKSASQVPDSCAEFFAPLGVSVVPATSQPTGPITTSADCVAYAWDGNIYYFYTACPDYDLDGLNAYLVCPNGDCASFTFERAASYSISASRTTEAGKTTSAQKMLPDVCIRIEKTS